MNDNDTKILQDALEKFMIYSSIKNPYSDKIDCSTFIKDKYIIIPAEKMIYYIFTHNKAYVDSDSIEFKEDNINYIRVSWAITSNCHTLLVNSLKNIVKLKDFTSEQIAMSYVRTIYNWSKKYNLHTTIILIDIFREAYEEYIYDEHNKLSNFYELSKFIIFENYKDINPTDKLSFIRMSRVIFDIKKNYINTGKIRNYINFIGIEYFYKFIDIIYQYMKELNGEGKRLEIINLFKIIINQYENSRLIPDAYIEKFIKIFAKNGFYFNKGLIILKSINSSYVDEYKSFLLMEDLKNG